MFEDYSFGSDRFKLRERGGLLVLWVIYFQVDLTSEAQDVLLDRFMSRKV